MTQQFFINQNSILPILEMSLVNDGRGNSHENFYNNLQDADITFNMVDFDTGVVRIANAPAVLIPVPGCEGILNIGYEWRERDTKRPGKYIGYFEIKFGGSFDPGFENRNLIVPIREQLLISIESNWFIKGKS